MLLAIARALQLDEDATAYLFQLAKPPSPRSKRTRRPEKVSDGIRTLISSWPLTPAYVHGTYMDILAANTLATALCPFSTPGRNAILDAFTEPEMRELRPDWDVMTARAVPHLRSIAGADTGDPRLAAWCRCLPATTAGCWRPQDSQGPTWSAAGPIPAAGT